MEILCKSSRLDSNFIASNYLKQNIYTKPTTSLFILSTEFKNKLCDHVFNVPNFYFAYVYSRTPGSRQPSPAEESLARGGPPFDATAHVGSGFPQHHLQHMLGSSMDHQGPTTQLNSYHPQLPPMNQLQPPVMNGVGGMQVAQVIFF